jgi:hypothetical protein
MNIQPQYQKPDTKPELKTILKVALLSWLLLNTTGDIIGITWALFELNGLKHQVAAIQQGTIKP